MINPLSLFVVFCVLAIGTMLFGKLLLKVQTSHCELPSTSLSLALVAYVLMFSQVIVTTMRMDNLLVPLKKEFATVARSEPISDFGLWFGSTGSVNFNDRMSDIKRRATDNVKKEHLFPIAPWFAHKGYGYTDGIYYNRPVLMWTFISCCVLVLYPVVASRKKTSH